MPDPLITVADLETRLGRTLEGAEADQADAFIDDASAIVRSIVGDDDKLDPTPDAVVPVVVGMVRRALENPHGHESERVGNYQYSGAKTEGIFATKAEAKALRKATGTLSVGSVELEGYLLPETGRWQDGSWIEESL